MNIIPEESFKGVHHGKQTSLHTLKNKNGLVAQITNYGGIIVSIQVPDRNGKLADIVQGYDTIGEYINGNGPYMGAVCGRCANRIAKGEFSLSGKKYKLAVNNGPNHLHGGITGFSKIVWDVVKSSPSTLKKAIQEISQYQLHTLLLMKTNSGSVTWLILIKLLL